MMGQDQSKEADSSAGQQWMGYAKGLTWLSPANSMAVKAPTTVPEMYIKPEAEVVEKILVADEVPVIDLAKLDGEERDDVLNSIDQACQEWGMFQIVNHGISSSLIAEYMRVMKEFFALPVEEKMGFVVDKFDTPALYGTRTKDWSDFLRLKCVPPLNPDVSHWPPKPEGLRKIAAEYSAAISQLAKKLLSLLSTNLVLESTLLDDSFQKNSFTYINNNFYPVCPEPKLALGLAGHSDPGGITILFQEICGLQAQKQVGGPWIDVEPLPNALVVNLADQIQILTNGQYKSSMHRSVVNMQQPRYSAAAIYCPDPDAIISPVSCNGQPPVYRARSFADYMRGYLNHSVYGKTYLSSLRQSAPTIVS